MRLESTAKAAAIREMRRAVVIAVVLMETPRYETSELAGTRLCARRRVISGATT